MPTRQIAYLSVLLVFTPFLILGQKVPNSGFTTGKIDLSGKTFIMREEEVSKASNDLKLLFIFHKDSSATFRVKRGNRVKDSPLSWRFVGDSLCLQPTPVSMEVEGKVQQIDRAPVKYIIIKTSGGYLFKGRTDQMLLVELK